MKKIKKVKPLHRNSADQIAKQLRKQFPKNKLLKEDNALKIARNLFRNLDAVGVGDKGDIFTPDELTKQVRVWKQVTNILAKQK